MAGVAELFFLALVEEEQELSSPPSSEIDFEEETLDHASYWSSFEDNDETLTPHPIFSPEFDRHPRSHYEEDTITLPFDILHRGPPPETLDTSDFRALDVIETMTSDYLGLGLGLGFDNQELEQDQEIERGDRSMDHGDGGLGVVGYIADSESESDPNPNQRDQDPSLPLCWDCLRLEDDRPDLDEEFEWEEVDDERDILSTMVGERSRSSEHDDEEDDDEEERNVEWEILLAVNNVGRNLTIEEEEDFINPSEYEILFGQFVDHESAIRGTPPAAKSVVENLPLIVLTQEDVSKNNALCAICKDEISLEEVAKQLPCLHHYHGECILPWLGIRNTCPVCRYELPTDDPEYESWKVQRIASNGGRYDLEIFSEV